MFYQKCDICKKVLKSSYVSARYNTTGIDSFNSKQCDLCGNCGKSILAFLNEKFPTPQNIKKTKK